MIHLIFTTTTKNNNINHDPNLNRFKPNTKKPLKQQNIWIISLYLVIKNETKI